MTSSGRGHSVAGFDNIGLGMLTVFQCTTLAGWAQVMYRVMDSGAELAVPYFVALVFFGAYFVVNLFLAVLKSKFGRARALFRAKVRGCDAPDENAASGDETATIFRDSRDARLPDARDATRVAEDAKRSEALGASESTGLVRGLVE